MTFDVEALKSQINEDFRIEELINAVQKAAFHSAPKANQQSRIAFLLNPAVVSVPGGANALNFLGISQSFLDGASTFATMIREAGATYSTAPGNKGNGFDITITIPSGKMAEVTDKLNEKTRQLTGTAPHL